MRAVITQLGQDNNFRDMHNGAGSVLLPEWNRSVEAIKENVLELKGGGRKFVGSGKNFTRGLFVSHVHYFKHEILGSSVEYINIARHPLNVTQSFFYYLIDDQRQGNLANRTRQARKADPCGCADMTFGECVRTADERGCAHINLQLTDTPLRYFCGYNPECAHDTEQRYQLARARLQQRYLFVGLTEQLELSAKMLERLLPDFFTGAPALVVQDELRTKTTTPYAFLTASEVQLLLDYPGNKYVLKLWDDIVAQFWSQVAQCELV